MIFRLRRWKSVSRFLIIISIFYSLINYGFLSKKIKTEREKVWNTLSIQQKNISLKLKEIKIKENVSSKFKSIETNKVNFKYNSTHLWNMRIADENYYRLIKLLPCRNVEYDIGVPSTGQINTCNQLESNQFSTETTLEAQKWIFNHQNPSNCTNKQFAIINHINWSGFGSTMHLITWAFAKALAQDRIVLYATPTNWPFSNCELGNPDCVFLPISNCSSLNKNTTIYISANSNKKPKSKPLVFVNKSFMWYRSQLMFYLLRFNDKTLDYVQHKIGESFIPPSIESHQPYISVYVRRSDKITQREMRQSYSLKQYFHLFEKDLILANITRIYLNSEDSNVFTEFKELNQNQSNRYQLLTINATKGITFNKMALMSQKERSHILYEFLTDLYIEIHADLNSGTLTSNYCRLVDALRLVLGKIIPFYTPEHLYITDS